MKKGFVYAIRDELTGFTKIGFSCAPERRLASLATASPGHLELLWSTPGTLKDERELHEDLRHHHIGREWFDLGKDPVGLIDAAMIGVLDEVEGRVAPLGEDA